MFPRAASSVAAPPSSLPEPFPAGDARVRDVRGREAERAAAVAAVAQPARSDPTSLAGLAACVEDATAAALERDGGPPDPASFASLRARLERASAALPVAYREAVADPLLRTLDGLGARGFARVLAEDPAREGAARLLLDLAQAVLQRGEGYRQRATSAFQEVVSDLYDGFLPASGGVRPPDHGVVAPLVRWGSADTGPYTWPATATATVGVSAAVVSLPAPNASGGILAWPALAHETAGHDVLAAYDGVRDELARGVRDRLLASGMGPAVAGYWAERIDETAADVLGVLNMGPAAAVGLIGYFRALNGAWRGTAALRSVGAAEDRHPADIARAYLAAEAVRRLSFGGASRWADRLVAEADRDLGWIRLGDVSVSAAVAKDSAAVVAQAIARTPLRALGGRALGDLQDWTDEDEAVVAELRRAITAGGDPAPVAARRAEGAYAAHAVAAAVYEAAAGTSRPGDAMAAMTAMLAGMHDRNPAWAPDRMAGPRVA